MQTAAGELKRSTGGQRGFRTILADPPWSFENWSERGNGRGAARHYQTQGLDWIKSLPVVDIAAKDCTLLLWACIPQIPEACEVLKAWGFRYKSAVCWVKMHRAGAPRVGLGYHVRGCVEPVLIATRGNPPKPQTGTQPLGAIFCPRGAHSRKPDFQYDLAENYPGPYIELFNRPREGSLFPAREGWTFVGNEADGQDIADALRALAASEVR